MAGPIKNSASGFTFYVALTSQADTDIFKVNPTLAAGDVIVEVDGTSLGNIDTLPDAQPDGGATVRVILSQEEINGDVVVVKFSDAAGAEWQDLLVVLFTETANLTSLNTAIAALASAAAIADAVWDEVISTGHAVSNSAGKIIYDNINAAVGSVPAAVWAAVTRTLTSGGGGATAQEVWEYVTRTLTQTAAQVAAAISGNNLTLTAGVSFAATLTGLTIPATWTKVYLTAKGNEKDPDSSSKTQLVESNPGVGTDGLLYLNGAAGTAAQGSLTVNQSAGTIDIVLAVAATVQFTSGWRGHYDVKCVLADGTCQVLTYGDFNIELTETKAIS